MLERSELGGRTVSEFDQAFRDPLEQPDGSARPSMLQSVLGSLKGRCSDDASTCQSASGRERDARTAAGSRAPRAGSPGVQARNQGTGSRPPSPGESFYAGLSRSLESDPPLGPREAPSLERAFRVELHEELGRRSTQGESLDVDGEFYRAESQSRPHGPLRGQSASGRNSSWFEFLLCGWSTAGNLTRMG